MLLTAHAILKWTSSNSYNICSTFSQPLTEWSFLYPRGHCIKYGNYLLIVPGLQFHKEYVCVRVRVRARKNVWTLVHICTGCIYYSINQKYYMPLFQQATHQPIYKKTKKNEKKIYNEHVKIHASKNNLKYKRCTSALSFTCPKHAWTHRQSARCISKTSPQGHQLRSQLHTNSIIHTT